MEKIEGSERIAELLVETGAYLDLQEPVILTSGELGIYYINTEKLLQDEGIWKEFSNDSYRMVQHAINMTEENPRFKEVIDILADYVDNLIPEKRYFAAISGGQRRDWLFSGPIANELELGHISLYKNQELEVIRSYETDYGVNKDIEDFSETFVTHIVDLITEGSSCYRQEDGKEKGWIPMLRQRGATVNDLVAVVTRLQGGEEILEKRDVNVHSFVVIDEDFLKTHSTNPERALAYQKNPQEWSEQYLKEKGALALIENWNPDKGKLDRARKFLKRYGEVLQQTDKWNELDNEVRKKYNLQLK